MSSQCLPNTKSNEAESKLTSVLPGYSFHNINRFGMIGLSDVAKMDEMIRLVSYRPELTGIPLPSKPGYAMTLGQLTKKYLVFVLSLDTKIYPALYNTNHVYNPVICTDTLSNIGTSSYQHISTVTSQKTGEILHSSQAKLVVVDMKTRRSTPLPDNFVNHFKPLDLHESSEKVVLVAKPPVTHRVTYQTKWSDCDRYMHVNQASHVTICQDAMATVSRCQVFSRLHDDVCAYRVSRFRCLYVSEARAEQTLIIHVWEDHHDAFTIHARSEHDNKPIVQMSVTHTMIDGNKL